MISAFGVDHGYEVSKSAKDALKLAGVGAAAGGAGAAGGGYLMGRTGRSNRKQTEKMGRWGGAAAGVGTGMVLTGPLGGVGGGLAGYYAGGKAGKAGAVKRIENRKKKS